MTAWAREEEKAPKIGRVKEKWKRRITLTLYVGGHSKLEMF